MRDPSFSKSESEIESTVEWSIAQWQRYISESDVQNRPRSLQLAVHFQRTTCEAADLQLYFGIQNETIEKYRAQDFIHPLAFTKRLRYDESSGWSRGLLWVSNDASFGRQQLWQSTSKFKAILLHEMGHVFGVTHMPGTIMQEEILQAVLQENAKDAYSLTHINNAWELSSPAKSEWTSGAGYGELGIMSSAAFFKLVGRAPHGEIRSRWVPGRMQILIQDDVSESVLNVVIAFERAEKTEREALFFAYLKNADGSVVTANDSRESFVKIGTLTTLSQNTLNIVIEKNIGVRHVQISYQSDPDGGFGELFSQPCEYQDVPFKGPVCFPVYPGGEG